MASKKPRKPKVQPGDRPTRTVQEALANLTETLDHAQHNLEESLSDDARRKHAGLRNFIVSARSVTFVLQTLRHAAPGFDEWYADVQRRLQEDPIANEFVSLRNEIEKEGSLQIVRRPKDFGAINVGFMPGRQAFRGAAPDDAEVITDGTGTYWLGKDGRRHYIRTDDLPGLRMSVDPGSRFAGALHSTGRSVEELTHYYFDRLEEIVVAARLQFGHLD